MPETDLLLTSDVPPGLLSGIRHLLDAAFDGAFTDEDWDHTLGGLHAVVREGDRPLAHAAVVPRTLEVDGQAFLTGYVEGVATAPDRQGEGLGSLAMTRLLPALRATYEFGALSTDRYGFYERLGWQRWHGPTFVRDGEQLLRTPDEDDGIMVLRFGPSADIPLDAPIACATRSGDDW